MKNDDLIKYLESVVDIEKNIYSLNTTIGKLEERKGLLGIHRIFNEIERPTVPIIPNLKKKIHWIFYILTILFGIAIFFMPAYMEIVKFYWPPLLFLFSIVCVFVVPWIISSINQGREIKNREPNKKYQQDLTRYYNASAAYREQQEEIELDRIRVAEEQKEIALINEWINKLTSFRTESEKCLNVLYSQGIIYPKYRNMVAVCSFLDYFSAGLCYTFEAPETGVGGAYYLFENEMLHKQIIMELQEVNENLDHIQINQYSLYSAVINANQKISELNDTLNYMVDETVKGNQNIDRLIEESKVSNYYAAQTQKELSYLNNMQYLSGGYDSVNPLFRTPPT